MDKFCSYNKALNSSENIRTRNILHNIKESQKILSKIKSSYRRYSEYKFFKHNEYSNTV